MRGLVLAVALCAVTAAGQPAPGDPMLPREQTEDNRCLQCHGRPHIAELHPDERRSMVGTVLEADQLPESTSPPPPGSVLPASPDEPPTRPGLLVQGGDFSAGPHAGVRCVECHTDAAQLPHAAVLMKATCATSCHPGAVEAYSGSSHREALDKGDELAPTCASCHGSHDILRVTDRKAPQHHLNNLFLCGDCHQKHGRDADGKDSKQRIDNYLESAHAKAVTQAGLLGAATCVDCHGAHGVRPSDDKRSSVSREHVPQTCGKCHEGVAETYATSIHGRKLAEGDKDAPVCTDCHTAHSITRASSPEFMADVISECGQCHDSPDRNGDRVGTYYMTYGKSYHGQVTRLGSTRAARCSDCHGAHDILPLDDPASRVGSANLVSTCGQSGCHAGANASFVKFDPHANYRDGKHYPILHGVWWYFIIVMSSVFTFFGLHTVLWFVRSMIEQRPAGHKHAHAPTAIRRFTGLNRVNHALVALTFFGLTATGIPLVFSSHPWARVLASLFGGIEAAGLWHRFFAILLIINFTLHFYGLGRAFLRRRQSWHQWLFGPASLIPRWKDVTDCLNMFRWFVGLGSRPSFDRWTYWEKFDYWAEVFGSMIIGGTGLLLWFPELLSKLLPGWAFNVAMIIHGYEALLAIGFIFTIHFFNAHIRPGTFPVDEVIFTGSVPEEELKEHRPEEYRRLVESGQLESLRVPAPSPSQRPKLILIAVVSVGIGVTLLALIILGGLGII
ncbi:MAG: hypothetical protein IPJ41_16250 [Phycisphaerales bacterium]|nr:hypothetical protein [Phycisphaerales bacterium]